MYITYVNLYMRRRALNNLYLLNSVSINANISFAECLDGPGSVDIAACTNLDGDDCVLDTFGLCGNGNLLQGAINSASNGDTILVPSGTYIESILHNEDFKKRRELK